MCGESRLEFKTQYLKRHSMDECSTYILYKKNICCIGLIYINIYVYPYEYAYASCFFILKSGLTTTKNIF